MIIITKCFHILFLPDNICKNTNRIKLLGFAAHVVSIKTSFLASQTNARYYGHSQASRSSICMIMKVMLTPATANGYSQAALLPPCFFNRR